MASYLIIDGRCLGVIDEEQREELADLERLRGVEFVPVAGPISAGIRRLYIRGVA